MDYVESKLGISYWWRWGVCSSRENCGFDVILLAAGRRGGSAGVQIFNVAVVAKWRNFLPSATEKWRANIDGVVQHEVSHLFGCDDVEDGHAKVNCIMAYWSNWFGWTTSYLYEYMSWGDGLQVDYWNRYCCCQTYFNDNYDMFYTIDTSST